MSSSNGCYLGTASDGKPAVIHKNEDYPYWELGATQTFPCTCGKFRLDRGLLVRLEPVRPDPGAIPLSVIKNEAAVAGFLRGGHTRWNPPDPGPKLQEVSGADITDELKEFNL
jgi:hypothetical protein